MSAGWRTMKSLKALIYLGKSKPTNNILPYPFLPITIINIKDGYEKCQTFFIKFSKVQTNFYICIYIS